MTDTQAHEAVMNKTWFQKVAEHEAQCLQQRMVSPPDAPRLPQKISSSRSLSMTIPAWASKKLQGEAALWSQKKDIGHGPASSSVSSTPTEEEFKYPLYEMIAPSMERIETFLSEEQKEPEQTSRNSLTMSWHMPSPDRDSSSSNQLRPRLVARLNVLACKHSARRMMRSMHGCWPTARLTRRTGMSTGRPAMETSTDHAFFLDSS